MGKFGGPGHEKINHNRERHLLEGRCDPGRMGEGHNGVGPLQDEALDRIGALFKDGIHHGPKGVIPSGRVVFIEKGVFEADGFDIRRKAVFKFDIPHGKGFWNEISPLFVDVATQGPQDADCPHVLRNIEVHIQPVSIHHAGRFGSRVEPRGLFDLHRIQPDARCHLFGRVGPGGPFQGLESDRPLLCKIRVIEPFGNQDMEHGHGQQSVAARPDL